MKYTYLTISLLSIAAVPSCEDKEDVPPARETTMEEVKDAVDSRDNELIKDIKEEITGEEEVVEMAPPAREDTKEEVLDALDAREHEVVKDIAEEVKEDAEALKEAAEETVEDVKDLTDGEE